VCLNTRSTTRSAGALLRKEKAKVSIKVRGGTPEGCESLCRSCTRGHVISGFRTTEEEVFCRFFFVEREIRFPVRECTFYEDRRIASKADMEEIAWKLRDRDTKSSPNLGFISPTQLREIESEDAEEVPVEVEKAPLRQTE
jgi:hypothetical protein